MRIYTFKVISEARKAYRLIKTCRPIERRRYAHPARLAKLITLSININIVKKNLSIELYFIIYDERKPTLNRSGKSPQKE